MWCSQIYPSLSSHDCAYLSISQSVNVTIVRCFHWFPIHMNKMTTVKIKICSAFPTICTTLDFLGVHLYSTKIIAITIQCHKRQNDKGLLINYLSPIWVCDYANTGYHYQHHYHSTCDVLSRETDRHTDSETESFLVLIFQFYSVTLKPSTLYSDTGPTTLAWIYQVKKEGERGEREREFVCLLKAYHHYVSLWERY